MESTQVPLGDVMTHPALQPRDPALLHARDRDRQEQQSAAHIEDMARLLKADSKADLVAVRIADVAGELYLVDGHHRFKAYKRAKRETIPAHVAPMTLVQASNASKLANVTHTKLEMKPAQKRNALWHHLRALTHDGTQDLPHGVSQRKLAGLFGCTHDTVARMLRKVAEVDPTAFPEEHRDGITGWPHWRYVSETARNGMYQAMHPDSRLSWKADKYRKKLVRLWETTDREAIELAHKWLREEAREESERALAGELEAAFWGATEDPEPF
jgi:uncharacterized ParB-like nuclease family protein